MTRVVVIGEGQTEESFVRYVLAPALWERQIYLEPRLIATSRHGRGGALSRDRVLRYLRNTLRDPANTYVTTLFDLHGLHDDFPGYEQGTSAGDPIARAEVIERCFAETVVTEAGCRADRFIPHIQPYEFEALLFSDVTVLASEYSEWKRSEGSLLQVRQAVPTPEFINDGEETHPSARLSGILRPSYEKVLHGTSVAKKIGLQRIREECHHFDAWLRRLESLSPLTERAESA